MSPSWVAFEIGINLFQSCLYLCFLKSRIHITCPSKVADVLCLLLHTLFLSAYLFYPVPFSDSVGAVIYLIYLSYVSGESWMVNLFWSVVLQIVIVITVGLSFQSFFALTSASYEQITAPSSLRLIFVLFTNLALLIAFTALSRLRLRRFKLAWPSLFFFVLLNIALLLAIELLFSLQVRQTHSDDTPFFLAYAALIACSLSSVILFHLMTDTAQRHHEAQLALAQAQLSQQHQQQLKELYVSFTARQHDFKQQLQILEQLVQSGNSPQAQSYLQEYQHLACDANTPLLSGSMAVDALLTAKQLICAQRSISFRLSLCNLHDLPIREVEFCTLVGNLLDNAIEGTLRIPENQDARWVRIAFLRVKDMFLIQCENSMWPASIRRSGSRFLTAKTAAPSVHGYGILNIENIVNNAEGSCCFETKEHVFRASVTLPFPLKEEYRA